MRMAATKPFLRSKDVAHILDMSPHDVVYLARKGKLRATKVGKYWQYRYRDVTASKRRTAKKD